MIEIKAFNKVLWLFPLVMVAAQRLPWEYALTIGILFTVAGLTKQFRAVLLFGFSTVGHLVWLFTFQYLTVNLVNAPLTIVLGRVGLIGYVILFFLWARFQPQNNRYFRLGDMKERLKFPFIWHGFPEYIWRFILVFCALCLAVMAFFRFCDNKSAIVLYGVLFAVINAFLEEAFWRGFILGRTVDFIGEKQALIVTSLAFGFYHLSLGFSVWVCLAFAIGGFYMGGLAIKSKGLAASIAMHFFVNMVFVSRGMIF